MNKTFLIVLIFISSTSIIAHERIDVEYIKGQRKYPRRVENLKRKTIEANIQERKCFMCPLARKTIGYITYGIDTNNYPFNPEHGCRIGVVEIDKDYRRKGIATQLIKKALEDMKAECRCYDITLTVANDQSEALFAKLGAKKDSDNRFDGGMYFEKSEQCNEFKEFLNNFNYF